MGRGKTPTASVSAYTDKINPDINNRTFLNNRLDIPEEISLRRTTRYYSFYLKNSENKIRITRNPFTISDNEARRKFLAFTSEFENHNNIKLADISKNELLSIFLDFAEDTYSILKLKDDARQFMMYRFLFPDILELYLYKTLYPRIFEFEADEKNTIKFRSSYIENNFKTIFKQINLLCYAITYDSMILAIESCSAKHIDAMKSYRETINPSDDVDTLISALKDEFHASNKPRTNLLSKLIPSIVFMAKHYRYLYKDRNIEDKSINTLLNHKTILSGKRSDDSRNALMDAYAECSEIIYNSSLPFTTLFNMYFINKRSYLYDLNIMKDNIEFMPYSLDGITTKLCLNKIIIDNNLCLNMKQNDRLELTSIYNNPNCVISNITPKDYEIIDFVIKRSAKTMEKYYLTSNNIDVPISKICEIIDLLDKPNFNIWLNDLIPQFAYLETNNVDYERIIKWHNTVAPGDEM